MERYVIDLVEIELSAWMPVGGGRWESLAVAGDPWMASVWEPNDPAAPVRSAYARHTAADAALVRDEAARIVAAGVATYRHAAHAGRLWYDLTPCGPRRDRTPNDIEHALRATAAQPWAVERTLTRWGDGAEPRTAEVGAMALRLGARAIADRAPEALRHRVSVVREWIESR